MTIDSSPSASGEPVFSGSLAAGWPWAVAILGGWWWGSRFGHQPSPWLAWASLAPLLWLALPEVPLTRRRRFFAAWLHGWVSWMVGIPWIAYTLGAFGGLPESLSWVLLTGLAAYLGLYHALFTVIGAALLAPWKAHRELGSAASLLALLLRWGTLPALWLLAEQLRAVVVTGFPWNLAAYAWVEVPGALALTAWLGSYGVSAVVVLAGLGFARAAALRRWSPAVAGTLIPLLLLALAGRWAQQPADARYISPPTAVRVLQPNIPNVVDFDAEVVRRHYRIVMEQVQRACTDGLQELEPLGLSGAQGGVLVILPESALWPFNWPFDAGLRRDVESLLSQGCSLLFNSPYWEAGAPGRGGRVFNSTYLVAPEAKDQRYDKRHLVPYGEYVPLGEVFPFIESLARNAGDFSAADEVRVLPWRQESLGVALCYEGIFPTEVAATVRAGATALVVMSNDAWFGTSAARRQHFRAARFRAAENRRPLLRAAITGVSGVIGADGRGLGTIGPHRRDVLSTWLQGRTDLSPYTRRPWLMPALAGLICLLAAAGGLPAIRRREVSSPSAADLVSSRPGSPPAHHRED
ncbi:MAG: apolipoprotein N-acyltransferase [Acidobacteriota bacterium]